MQYYLDMGFITSKLYQKKLSEVVKSEVCVPNEVVYCTRTSLTAGPSTLDSLIVRCVPSKLMRKQFFSLEGADCPQSCTFLRVQAEDVLERCQASEDPCCQYSISEEACDNGITVGVPVVHVSVGLISQFHHRIQDLITSLYMLRRMVFAPGDRMKRSAV